MDARYQDQKQIGSVEVNHPGSEENEMRKLSEKTQIKNLRYDCSLLRDERDRLKVEREQYRVRATKAEQECAEWKNRFDVLLKREDKSVGTT